MKQVTKQIEYWYPLDESDIARCQGLAEAGKRHTSGMWLCYQPKRYSDFARDTIAEHWGLYDSSQNGYTKATKRIPYFEKRKAAARA